MYSTIVLSPADIRFVHDSIRSHFRNGNRVNDTIKDIANGLLRVDALPMIRVILCSGNFFSLDNRRLYVYRVLHYRGLLKHIQVKLVPITKLRSSKFTTRNNGTSVFVRRDKTKHHYRPPASNIR